SHIETHLINSRLLRAGLSRAKQSFASQCRSVGTKGVLDYLDTPELIDKRGIKPHGGQQPGRKAAAIFQRSITDARDLSGTKPERRPIMAARLLDLDKDVFVTLAQDQVDFAATPAPAFRHDLIAALRVFPSHRLFCKPASGAGNSTAMGIPAH